MEERRTSQPNQNETGQKNNKKNEGMKIKPQNLTFSSHHKPPPSCTKTTTNLSSAFSQSPFLQQIHLSLTHTRPPDRARWTPFQKPLPHLNPMPISQPPHSPPSARSTPPLLFIPHLFHPSILHHPTQTGVQHRHSPGNQAQGRKMREETQPIVCVLSVCCLCVVCVCVIKKNSLLCCAVADSGAACKRFLATTAMKRRACCRDPMQRQTN